MAADEGEFLLPVGTVTLLLADVEGSTRLWESQPEVMPAALAELDEVVLDAVGRHNGVRPLEQGEGDSLVAAFARATDAVACAVALQRALVDGRLKLRVGVHTGEVLMRGEGNYAGPALNRAARLRDAGHGGQVLLSQVTHDLVVDRLPDGVSLSDLGAHRLRDLRRPERIFQLRHPDLAGEFPPLRTLDRIPHNLPVALTSFVGRAKEMEDVVGLLAGTRLLTLTGSGGCGKTRLALQIAGQEAVRFPGGAWFADLAAVSDPSAVGRAVGAAIGIEEDPSREVLDQIAIALSAGPALVVLDNCEHVVDACAGFAESLVRTCPDVSVVATSREQLGAEGEVTYRVPSLAFPDPDQPPTPEALGEYAAVELFVDRARRVRSGFTLDDSDTAAAVAEICRRLDGIALAIELAAARVRMLTPRQIADGLQQRFRILTGGRRTAVPRQQTLRASVDWSHELLNEDEQIVFRRLGVFAGSFALEATEDVAGVENAFDVLSQLVDKSLVQVEPEGRYRLLETIRQYALDRLATAGEGEAARNRHRDHYLALAERADPELWGPAQEEWVDRLDLDLDNLRAAFEWCVAQEDGDSLGLTAGTLYRYWLLGPTMEGLRWLETAVALGAAGPARGLALVGLASLTIGRDIARHLAMAREAVELLSAGSHERLRSFAQLFADFINSAITGEEPPEPSDDLDDTAVAVARVLQTHGAVIRGRLQVVVAEAPRALAVATSIGDHYLVDRVRTMVGVAALQRGDPETALCEAEQVIARERRNYIFGIALRVAANARAHLGDLPAARDLAERHRDFSRSLGYSPGHALLTMARLARDEGDFETAVRCASDAAAAWAEPDVYQPLFGLAAVELRGGRLEAAERHTDEGLQNARQLRNLTGIRWGLSLQARLRHERGEAGAAEDLAHEALAVALDQESEFTVAGEIAFLALLAEQTGSSEEAARLLGAADAGLTRTKFVRPPSERPEYDDLIARLRGVLGEDYDRVYGEGAALSMTEAAAYARRGRGERKRPTTGWDALTPSERGVVDLVAQGLSNAEVASRLFVSARTVQSHLGHAFTKLGVRSRGQLIAEALRRGA